MEANFKIKKRGQYFESTYLRCGELTIHTWVNIYHQDRASAEKYMQYILDIEPLVKGLLEADGLKHDPTRVIAEAIKILESWADGFDIRADLGIEKHAEMITEWFVSKYDKAMAYRVETDEYIKENGGTYLSNWARYDKSNVYNRTFNLGFEDLDTDSECFAEDELKRLIRLTGEANEMLDVQIKERRK